MSDHAASPPAVFYEAVLAPHRSLPPAGFHIVMLLLAGVSFVVGVSFVMMGAWPVTGFFGLDVLLLYLAFRASYRAARDREIVRLTAETLTVERLARKGAGRWRFEPFWLRVILEGPDRDPTRLVLASHGRALELARFLGPSERRRAGEALRDALARWRLAIVGG